MKAISGVLLGYAVILLSIGTAFAQKSDAGASGSAPSSTRTEGSVDVQDLRVIQGHTESAANVEANENTGAPLDAIRDRARSTPHKALAKSERKLTEISRQMDAETTQKGDSEVASRVAPEFRMTGGAMLAEEARLDTGLGDLVIAHTLMANSKKSVTTDQLFTLQREGFGWTQIAYGLDLRAAEVAGAVESEARVAFGKASADGRPAMIQSQAGADAGANVGVNAGRASMGTSSSAGVGLNLGK